MKKILVILLVLFFSVIPFVISNVKTTPTKKTKRIKNHCWNKQMDIMMQTIMYLFKHDNDLNNPYYEKTKNKLLQYSLEDNFTEKNVKSFVNSLRPYHGAPVTILDDLLGDALLFHPVIFVIVCIIIYLIAVFLSNETTCVIAFHFWARSMIIWESKIF